MLIDPFYIILSLVWDHCAYTCHFGKKKLVVNFTNETPPKFVVVPGTLNRGSATAERILKF